MKRRRAALKAIFSYLAPEKLTNNMLAERFPDWNIDKAYQNTGVAVRSIAAADQCTSDLGIIAAEKMFAAGVCNPQDIDFLLFCTQTPDYFLPASACLMQDRLGLPTSCGAFDFNLGCSGYVYGLALGKGLIEAGLAENVLLIVGDTPSKAINPRDKGALALFSDGASATLLTALTSEDELIGPFVFGTDGKGAKNLIIPAGAFRQRSCPETRAERMDNDGNVRSPEQLFMDGAEIFNFTLQAIPPLVNRLLENAGLIWSEIDYVIFHQANQFMLEALRRKIKIPKEKFALILETHGNTSSASIPMALEIALQEGRIAKGNKILISGFGVGYSMAAAIITLI